MDILHAHVTTDPKSLRVATKNKDLDKSLRVATKNKDLDFQLLPAKPTDPEMPPPDSPAHLASLPSILPLAPPVVPSPLPCAPALQPVSPPLCWSPHNHPGSHCATRIQPTTPMAPLTSDTPYWALHGNAFNPDTGELAKYTELSHSSDGHLWHTSNTAKIHCSAQVTPAIPRTNTMCFIVISQLPPGTKAMYLCVVCAFHPKKIFPTACIRLLVATALTMPAMSVPKWWTCPCQDPLQQLHLNAPCPGMMGDLKDFYLGTPWNPRTTPTYKSPS